MRHTFILLPLLATAAAGEPTHRVVIDPGHGGSNLGAPTMAAGVHEKVLTLDLAHRLRAEIARLDPTAEVVLTRDRDRYVTLRGRAGVANARRADVLVSLHLNASRGARGEQSGFETYVYGAGPLLEPDDSASGAAAEILADLHGRAAAALSSQLAATVQRRLAEARGGARDRGVRQAPLDVLREAHMPAVLVEAAFVDHPREGREILDAHVRQEIAAAIALALVE
ncbi:MAG: N-acetylmuramoyl-L-alanine amidase, partial [Myxococcota bacterium]